MCIDHISNVPSPKIQSVSWPLERLLQLRLYKAMSSDVSSITCHQFSKPSEALNHPTSQSSRFVYIIAVLYIDICIYMCNQHRFRGSVGVLWTHNQPGASINGRTLNGFCWGYYFTLLPRGPITPQYHWVFSKHLVVQQTFQTPSVSPDVVAIHTNASSKNICCLASIQTGYR